MKKIALIFSLFIFLFFFQKLSLAQDTSCDPQSVNSVCSGYSSSCQDKLNQCLATTNQALQDLNKALAPNEALLNNILSQIQGIKDRVKGIEDELAVKRASINKGYESLIKQKDSLNKTISNYYIKSYYNSPFILLLSSNSAVKILQNLAFQKALADQDREKIVNFAILLTDLENQRRELESEEVQLTATKAKLDQQSTQLNALVTGAKAYQTQLLNQLAGLSDLQNNLIAAKSGNFSVSVGSAALADDFNGSFTGWQNNAPGGSVTIFSFGAYANNGSNYQRNGMSQYGAWARAKNNEDYNQILQDYYGAGSTTQTMPDTINTDQGTMPFETQYLYGIAEMPSSWTDNNNAALKAQAVAARTFAYHYIQAGSTICTNDNCQVYSSSKVGDPAAAAWRAAVDATKGQVLPDNVHAQYASTPGGYLDTKGWDTNCGNQGCLANGAWDASSPWFYKAWYSNYKYGQGFLTCQRTNPWLSQSDISDILNTWVVYTKGTDDDRSHILPPDGCGGGTPYSVDQMRDRANALGGAISSVSVDSVQQNGGGYTSQVSFNGGQIVIPGFNTSCTHPGSCQDFWTIFNLRAPGNISIKSRLFDIRSK